MQVADIEEHTAMPGIMGQPSLEVLDVKKLQKEDETISFIFPFVRRKIKPTSKDVRGKPKRSQLIAWQWQKLQP